MNPEDSLRAEMEERLRFETLIADLSCFHHVSKTQGIDLVHKRRGCNRERSPGGFGGSS